MKTSRSRPHCRRKLLSYYETPPDVCELLVSRTVRAFRTSQAPRSEIVEICDLFAGDGRLGRGVAEALQRLGYVTRVTFVDVDARRKQLCNPTTGETYIVRDAFHWQTRR